MTPDEQNELDTLKQQLRQTEKLLADANGRIKAVEHSNYEIKRNAQIATEQAQALKNETLDSLTTASEQMKQAHAIACGIFGMSRLSWAFLERKATAARVVYRETKDISLMQSLLDAIKRKDEASIQSLSETIRNRITARKTDTEDTKNKAVEHLMALGFKNVQRLYEQIQKDGQV